MKTLTRQKMLRDYSRDSSWIHRRFERLRKRYPNQFVAVHGGRIIARGRSIPSLQAKIRKVCPEAIQTAAVQFLPKEDLILILSL